MWLQKFEFNKFMMLLGLNLGLDVISTTLRPDQCQGETLRTGRCTMLGLNLGISSVSTKHAPDFLCVSSYQIPDRTRPATTFLIFHFSIYYIHLLHRMRL